MTDDALSQLYFKDTAFQNLMQKRIFNVLLIASAYDAFMMEEDGRVEEQLYFEYTALNLSSPRESRAHSTPLEAMEIMKVKSFDLVIMMPGNDVSETFSGARRIREAYPDMPIIVLTPFSKEVSRRLANEDFSGIDYVFSWLGNVDLLPGHHKTARRQDERRCRHQRCGRADDTPGGRLRQILLVGSPHRL